jgi:periplasmic protein TonB
LPAYRLSSPYERPPLRRRLSGLALALAVNLALVVLLLWLGRFAPEAKKVSQALVVDFLPESHSVAQRPANRPLARPQRKTPPVVLPAKPTIAVPPPVPEPVKPLPLIQMSKEDLAAGDIGTLAKSGSGSAGDSEVAGRGPHGEVLYRAEWARHPTSTELGGYLPRNADDGFGLVACKTIPGNRVEDCVELDQTPGSHLASAVRQAAWQFRVRPPRKNGIALVGSWVSIRIDYEFAGRDDHGAATPWSRSP